MQPTFQLVTRFSLVMRFSLVAAVLVSVGALTAAAVAAASAVADPSAFAQFFHGSDAHNVLFARSQMKSFTWRGHTYLINRNVPMTCVGVAKYGKQFESSWKSPYTHTVTRFYRYHRLSCLVGMFVNPTDRSQTDYDLDVDIRGHTGKWSASKYNGERYIYSVVSFRRDG